MRSARRLILDWAEQGAIRPDQVGPALAHAGVLPSAAEWRRFVSALLLWLGALLVAVGVIFFFAYNWEAMGRFAKFGLAEALLAVAVIAALYVGLDKAAGKAAIFVAALLTGALLALVGQTYQTGADPYQLFAGWAVLILPWAAVSRLPALWLLLVALLNLAVTMYFVAFGGFFGLDFSGDKVLWVLFSLNTAALAIWELAASVGVAWLQERWPARMLAAASGIAVTTLALWAIVDDVDAEAMSFVVYVAWLAAAYAWYRMQVRDLFVLAGGVLSVIVVVAAVLSRAMLRASDAGGFLLIGVAVIGMSAAGAWWLKGLAAEDER